MQNACYGQNHVPSKLICWSPNLQSDYTVGDRTCKEVRKDKWSNKGEALILQCWCPLYEQEETSALSLHYGRARWDGGFLRTKKKALTRNQTGQYFDMDSPVSRTRRTNFDCWSHSIYCILLWQPRLTNRVPVPFHIPLSNAWVSSFFASSLAFGDVSIFFFLLLAILTVIY